MDYVSAWCRTGRRLEGRTAVVTGGNTGIGRETALDLYCRGCRVVLACRDIAKGEAARREVERAGAARAARGEPAGTVVVERVELASAASVRAFAARVLAAEPRVHVLVNNAGVMCAPRGATEDGFETHIGTNHFGHALLTLLLLPSLVRSAPSRIIYVSSFLHQKSNLDLDDVNLEKTPYDPMTAYCRSKCANVLFARALANKLKEHGISGVSTYSVHPGVVRTEIGRHFSDTMWPGATWLFQNIMSWFVKSPRCGAQTTLYCAVHEACADESGLYYSECAATPPSTLCQSDAAAARLWDLTVQSLNLTDYNPFGHLDPEEKYLAK